MSRRLKRANPLAEALPVLVALHAPLQKCFEVFFPALRNFAEVERIRLVGIGLDDSQR
jgi:acyl carrier protein phosphodiesterase